MRRLGRLKTWTARKWRNHVKPVLSDTWYAVKTGSLLQRCLGNGRQGDEKDFLDLTKEDLELAKTHTGVAHHEKPVSMFDKAEVVRFIRKEITLGDAKGDPNLSLLGLISPCAEEHSLPCAYFDCANIKNSGAIIQSIGSVGYAKSERWTGLH